MTDHTKEGFAFLKASAFEKLQTLTPFNEQKKLNNNALSAAAWKKNSIKQKERFEQQDVQTSATEVTICFFKTFSANNLKQKR